MANIAARRPSRTVAARHPDVTLREVDVDAMAAEPYSRPDSFDVILTSNMYGDILSKLANALAGSVGLASVRNVGETHAAAMGGRPGRGHAQGVALAGHARMLSRRHQRLGLAPKNTPSEMAAVAAHSRGKTGSDVIAIDDSMPSTGTRAHNMPTVWLPTASTA
jgi:hypothetical protein